MMKKPNKLVLWLIVAITLGIAIALICINLYVNQKTLIIVLLVIDFLVMTFTLQAAISATFRYKPKPKKYPSTSFTFNPEQFLDNLIAQGFKENKVRYGNIYLKVEDKTAYKIIVITDIEAYLTPENNNQTKSSPNKALKDCTRFVGQEVFIQYNDKALANLPDFSFQGKNIYYEAFYYDDEAKLLIEPNAITPNAEFSPYVTRMREVFLGLKENN